MHFCRNQFISEMGLLMCTGMNFNPVPGSICEKERLPVISRESEYLFAVRIVCPLLDDLFRRLAAPPVVVLGGFRPVLIRILIVNIGRLRRGFLRVLLRRPLGLLIPVGIVPLAARVPAPVPPVISLRSLGVLSLPGLAAGGLWLRLFVFHNVQTDKSGQEPQIVWHSIWRKPDLKHQ